MTEERQQGALSKSVLAAIAAGKQPADCLNHSLAGRPYLETDSEFAMRIARLAASEPAPRDAVLEESASFDPVAFYVSRSGKHIDALRALAAEAERRGMMRAAEICDDGTMTGAFYAIEIKRAAGLK